MYRRNNAHSAALAVRPLTLALTAITITFITLAQSTTSAQQPPPPPPASTKPAQPAPPPPAPTGAAAAAPAAATAAPTSGGDKPDFKPEELEQMLAPIALYPDSLLSQIFMAATYPLEVVEADRWVKANKSLQGDALTKALEAQTWDASVKSLVNFPQVLEMMSTKLDWTQKLGDAFIGQQKQVMDTVQSLRTKANAQGALKSTNEQTVKVEQQQTTTGGSAQVIVIESKDPDVIYVPQYNPTVVYGAWPYPAYPPAPVYPPGYNPVATAAVSFGVGVACGLAWGYACGGCNWGHGDVDINVNQNFNRNTNINRQNLTRNNANLQNGQGAWQHDAGHRGNVPYRNSAEASRFGGTSAGQATQARNEYRGRAEAGRQDIARGGASEFRGNNPTAGNLGNRTGGGGGVGSSQLSRPGAGGTQANRSGAGVGNTQRGTANSARSGSAFDGAGTSRGQTMSQSDRGWQSRSGSPGGGSARSAPARSSGGGGSRGGGGGGGGGRGGGGGGGRR
jgi:hypothetical protein